MSHSSVSATGTPSAWAIGVLAVGFGLVAIVLLILRDQADQPLPASPPQTAGDVSDEQLRKFALIFNEVEDILAGLRYQKRGARDQRALEQAQRGAEGQMIDAVRRNGMEVEEYQQITRLLNEDPELVQRLRAIQKKIGGGAARQRK